MKKTAPISWTGQFFFVLLHQIVHYAVAQCAIVCKKHDICTIVYVKKHCAHYIIDK